MIGVFRYTIKLGLPHLKVVIIDSPLTTYKERDMQVEKEQNEQKVKEDEKNAFFESFGQYQLIILDNIELKKESI